MDVRKIVSQAQKEKHEQKKKIIISVVLGLIMLFSTAGYAFFTSEESKQTAAVEKDNYNGLELTRTDYGSWKFTTASGNFETKYSPRDTENISVTAVKSLQNYAGNPLYFGVDSAEDAQPAGNYEILLNLQPI